MIAKVKLTVRSSAAVSPASSVSAVARPVTEAGIAVNVGLVVAVKGIVPNVATSNVKSPPPPNWPVIVISSPMI